MSRARDRPWTADDRFGRRRELYRRAASVFAAQGYHGASLKALAHACGLSIAGLYRYFPSKRAFALYPLVALYPELHPPPPDLATADPSSLLAAWIDAAVAEAPGYLLAARLLGDAGLTDGERAQMEAELAAHIEAIGGVARRGAPHLSVAASQELAATMVNLVMAPALTGLQTPPPGLRRQLRALLRGYGVVLP